MSEQLGFEPEEITADSVLSTSDQDGYNELPLETSNKPEPTYADTLVADMKSVKNMPVENLNTIFNFPFTDNVPNGDWHDNLRIYFKKKMAILRERGQDTDRVENFLQQLRQENEFKDGKLITDYMYFHTPDYNMSNSIPANEQDEFLLALHEGNDYLKKYAAETLSLLRPADPPESKILLRPHEATSGNDYPDELLRASDGPEDGDTPNP